MAYIGNYSTPQEENPLGGPEFRRVVAEISPVAPEAGMSQRGRVVRKLGDGHEKHEETRKKEATASHEGAPLTTHFKIIKKSLQMYQIVTYTPV